MRILTQIVTVWSCSSFLTFAGSLCSMPGSDYPPRCLTSLSVWAVSSPWCSSLGSWLPALTTGPAMASSLTSDLPPRPSGWAWPWPSLYPGCGEKRNTATFFFPPSSDVHFMYFIHELLGLIQEPLLWTDLFLIGMYDWFKKICGIHEVQFLCNIRSPHPIMSAFLQKDVFKRRTCFYFCRSRYSDGLSTCNKMFLNVFVCWFLKNRKNRIFAESLLNLSGNTGMSKPLWKKGQWVWGYEYQNARA